jgi:hypothetical protein
MAYFSPPKIDPQDTTLRPQTTTDITTKNHHAAPRFSKTPLKNARKTPKKPRLTTAAFFLQNYLSTSLKHLLDPPQRLPRPLLILNQRKPHMPIPMLAKTHARTDRNLRLQQ